MARAVRFLKDSQVEFSKLFSELCRMKSSWEAWTDFVAMSATTIANAFDQEGPFYGVKVEAANHMTKGGVLANENAQVLTTENEVVEGLYAAGEVTSTSGAYSAAVVFGRISGTKAAEYILGE